MPLNLHLCVGQLLVELLQICLWLYHEGLFRNIAKGLRDNFIESPRLLNQLLLYCEEVPILADRLEKIVEELIELLPQIVPDEQYVIPQIHLVFAKRGTD